MARRGVGRGGGSGGRRRFGGWRSEQGRVGGAFRSAGGWLDITPGAAVIRQVQKEDRDEGGEDAEDEADKDPAEPAAATFAHPASLRLRALPLAHPAHVHVDEPASRVITHPAHAE